MNTTKNPLGFITLKKGHTEMFNHLMSKSSWGSKQLRELGIIIPKTSVAKHVAVQYYVRSRLDMNYPQLVLAVDELSNSLNSFKSVEKNYVFVNRIKDVWFEYKSLMEYEKELKALRYIIVRLGLWVSNRPSTGRIAFENKLFEIASHVCDMTMFE